MRLPVSIRYALRIAALPLLAIAVALIAFVWGSQPGTTEAATNGAAMSLRVDASQTVACQGGPVAGKVCVVGGQTFDVIVVADAIPLTNGYIRVQTWIDYDSQGLVMKKTDTPRGPRANAQVLWPDCEQATFLTAQFPGDNGVSGGCLTSLLPPQPASFHKGDLFSFSFTCTTAESSSALRILTFEHPAGTAGADFVEFVTGAKILPSVTGITVDCVAAMSLRVDASQTVDCLRRPVAGEVCVVQGQKFNVIVVADAIPSNGYWFAQAWIDYDDQGLVHKKNTQVIWPDCEGATFTPRQDEVNNGASTRCWTGNLPPRPSSMYKGDLFAFSLTCTDDVSSNEMRIVRAGDPIADAPGEPPFAGTNGPLFIEEGIPKTDHVPAVSGVTVNCVTPPPTPDPVGGIVVDPELRALPLETLQQAGPSIGVLGVIAMAVGFVALVVLGAALSARRRGRV